jgi:UbiD family decarboxylase
MDLSKFVDELANRDEILTVRKKVNPRFELAAVSSKVQKTTNKAVLFENVAGSRFPVLTNLLGTYKRVGIFLGHQERDLVRMIGEKLNQTPFVQISAKQPRETIEVKELGHQIPIVTHYEKDAGPYITAGIILAKDPETGINNLSYHRMQWAGKNELRFRITPGHHLGLYFDKVEKKNQNLEAVVLIGASPAIMLAAAFGLPYDWDEIQVAGTLQGKPVELITCETVDLKIPSDTAIAIEGEILHHVRKPEGPYGDWMGNYIPVTENNVFRARTITLSPHPYYYTILSGSPEDVVLIGMPVAVSMYRNVKKVVPSVVDAACWPFLFYGIIQIEKKAKGEGKKAALAALGTDMEWLKYCIVVDPDVDIYNPQDVLWAMATRCSPERDVIKIPGVPSFGRDPYQMHWGRVIFDATAPFGLGAEFERKQVPFEESVRLEDYVDSPPR